MGIFSSSSFFSSFCDVRGKVWLEGGGKGFFFFTQYLGGVEGRARLMYVWRTWYLSYADAVVDIL